VRPDGAGKNLTDGESNEKYMNITVDPKMLQWVRQRAGLTVDELAHRVGVRPQKVVDWEFFGNITLKQAEDVAQVTHSPFGYLYLDEPPDETLPISDFRTLGSGAITSISLELRETIDLALARQAWYRENAISNGYDRLGFVGSLTGDEDIISAARRIRDQFALTTAIRSRTSDLQEAFTIQRMYLEQQGVLVMRSRFAGEGTNRPLDIHEFRGFALSDEYAPLLFINGQDYKPAQMFTMMHELVHLWIGVSGISNLNRTYASGKVETFCNAVAAEILVPEDELRILFSDASNIEPLVSHFKVSRLVILRRLRDLNLMSRREFVTRYRGILSRLDEEARRIEEKSKGGGYYRTKISRLGKPFVTAVVESTLEGRTPPSEAFYLLGLRDFTKVRRLAQELKFGNF
jgi:Zn-dependent peptidase ImmA (M78 family)